MTLKDLKLDSSNFSDCEITGISVSELKDDPEISEIEFSFDAKPPYTPSVFLVYFIRYTIFVCREQQLDVFEIPYCALYSYASTIDAMATLTFKEHTTDGKDTRWVLSVQIEGCKKGSSEVLSIRGVIYVYHEQQL